MKLINYTDFYNQRRANGVPLFQGFCCFKQGQTVHKLQIATFWDIYKHILLNFFKKSFLWVLCLKKSLKILPFSKTLNPKSLFLNISQKFLHTPFLPYFVNQHM